MKNPPFSSGYGNISPFTRNGLEKTFHPRPRRVKRRSRPAALRRLAAIMTDRGGSSCIHPGFVRNGRVPKAFSGILAKVLPGPPESG